MAITQSLQDNPINEYTKRYAWLRLYLAANCGLDLYARKLFLEDTTVFYLIKGREQLFKSTDIEEVATYAKALMALEQNNSI